MSSEQAKRLYSITIGGKNTWDDWRLVPASRPSVSSPAVKTSYVDIPGGDGLLDLTEALAGKPTYGNREGTWEFTAANISTEDEYVELYSEILAHLHGKSLKAVMDDDPLFYYEGRFAVNTWKSDKAWFRIAIDYNVGPYKITVYGTDEDSWTWDFMDPETELPANYKNMTVSGSTAISITNDTMEVVPTFIASEEGMTVTYNGKTYSLAKGENLFRTLRLGAGASLLNFTGNGLITVAMHEGRL